MAEKKQKVDLGEFDLDDLFGPDGMDDFSIDPPNKKRAPIETVTGVAITAGKKLIKDRSFIRTVLKNALPKGYVQTYDAVDTAQRNTRNLYNEAMSEIRPGLREVKRATNALLPRFEKSVPPAIAKYLKKFASSTDDERAFSVERARRESMDYDFKEIFEAQAEIDSYNNEKQTVERAILDKKAQNRHEVETELLSQINTSTRRLAGYQDSILAKYHRKSLELQYLQYYSLVDLLETTKTSNKSIVRNLADIVHNSALPDFLKLRTGEAGRQWLRERTFGKLGENYGEWASNFGSNILKNVSGAVMRKAGAVGQGLSEASVTARAAATASQFMSEDGKRQAKQETAASALGAIGRAGASKFGKWAGKYAKRIPGVDRVGSDLGYVAGNWQNMASDWGRSQTDLLKPGGFLIQAIKDAIPGYDGSKTTVKNDGTRGEFEASPFTGGAHRSLTEIIPGFLSRILQSTEGIRTGRKQERMVYNYDRSEFTTYRDSKRDVFDRLVGSQGKFFSQGVDDLVGQIDENGELDKDAKSVLRRQLFTDVGRGGSGFNPKRYARASAFGEADKDVAERLASFIQKTYGVSVDQDEPGSDYLYDIFGEEEGVVAGSKRRVKSALKGARGHFQGSDSQRDKRNKDVKLFNELRTYAPEIGELLSGYANSGQREILRDLGLLKKRGTADVVDNDFLWRYLGEQDASTSSLKEEKNGERRPESNSPRRRVRPGYVGPGTSFIRGAYVPGATGTDQADRQEVKEEAHREQPRRVTEDSSMEEYIDRIIAAIRESSGKELLSEVSQITAQILLKLDEGVGAGPGDGFGSGPVKRKGLFRKGLHGLMNGAMWGARKYVNLTMMPLRGAKWLANKTVGNMGRWGMGRLRGDWKEKSNDVFVKGELTPRIRKAQMESGELIDVLSKKPIHAFKDITGPVKDAEGNDVLSEEDFRKGLRDGRGRTLAGKFLGLLGKGARGGLTAGLAAFKLQFLPLTLGWKAAKGISKLSSTFFDVYVKGDPNPRLRANLLRSGNYINGLTQKPILKYSDINGPVLDREGNVVLSLEDVSKGLVDRWGKPIGGLGKKLLLGGTQMLWKGAKMAGKGALSALKYGGMLAASPLILAGKLAGKLGGGLGLGGLFGGGKNGTLEKIYELLQERLPRGKGRVRGDASGDGVRDNSWTDIVKQRKEKLAAWWEKKKAAKAERDAAKGKKKEGDGILGKLMMMFGGVMGMMKNLLSPLGSLVKILGSGFAEVLGLLGKGKLLKAAGSVLSSGVKAGGAVLGTAGRVAMGTGKLAMGAGRLAVSGAGWALRALPMLATPWGAGIAAVALVGYGGYKAYRYMRERMGLVSELRMLEYGFDPKDESKVKAVRELEAHLVDHTTFGSNGEVKIDDKIDFDSVVESFGVSDQNQQSLSNFAFWYRERFLPVYRGNLTALRRVDTKLALPEIDRVDDKLKYKLATAIAAAVGGKPLSMAVSPFASDRKGLITGNEQANAKIEEIRKKYGSDDDGRWSRAKGALNDDGTVRAMGTAPVSTAARQKAVEDAKTPGAMSFVDEAIANKDKEKAVKSGKFVWSDAQNRTIDELTSIRMRAYGLIDLDILDVGVIQGLEEAAAEKVTFGWFGGAEFKGEVGDFYNRFGVNFGCNPSNNSDQTVWKYWFEYRFLPVLLSFMAALHRADRQATVLNAWSLLKYADQVQVAQAIISTNSMIDGREVSVWSVDASPFPGKMSNVDARSIDDALASLKSKIKQDKLNESKFRDAKKDAERESQRTWMEKQATSGGGTQYGGSRPMSGPNSFGLGGGASGTGGGSSYGPPPGVAGDGGDTGPIDYGREIHPGNGSGGDVNSLPVPKGNGYDNVKDLILSVAQMTGVDPSLLMMMCAVESDFKITATPGTSNAAGLFQFIPSTWKAMLKTYGGKYGIGPDTSPMDPRANALMGAEYVKENYQQLARRLGRSPTENDLYLAHFLGAGGSIQVLKGNPNDIAARLNPDAAKANQSIFYDNGRPRTVRELIAKVNENIRKKISHYGIAANETAKTGKDVKVLDAPKAPNAELQPTTELGPMGPKQPVAGGDWGADTKPTLEADPSASTNVAADTASTAAAALPQKTDKPTTPPTTTPSIATRDVPPPMVDPSLTSAKDHNEDRKIRMAGEQQQRQQRLADVREREVAKAKESETAEDKELIRQQSRALASIDGTLRELLTVVKTQASGGGGTTPQSPVSNKRRTEIAGESRPIPVPMGRN